MGQIAHLALGADYRKILACGFSLQQAADLEPIGRTLAGLAVPELAIRSLNPVPDAFPQLTAQHRKFMEGCAAGNFVREGMSELLARTMDENRAAGFMQPLIANGKVTDFRVVERPRLGENDFRSRYGMWQGKQVWLVTIHVTADGTVTGLFCETP